MIEKNIHQIWMQGIDKFPIKFQKYSKIIKDMHALNWNYIFWDKNSIQNLMNEDENWKTKYKTFIYLHQKVDFAKLVILYKFGGIVIDADAYTIKPLDSLFDIHKDAELIVSFLKRDFLPIGNIQSLVTCNKFSECINNGNYIAKKESNILSYIIDEFINIPICSLEMEQMMCIKSTTGPYIFDKSINKYIKENDDSKSVVILPYVFLEPCFNKKCFITDETYIVHKHEMSWVNNIAKFYVLYADFFNIFTLFILSFILFLICIFCYNICKKLLNSNVIKIKSKKVIRLN
jgi:mannosyltransferase OCH1-like enzyme